MTWLLVTRRPYGPALALLGLIPRHPYSAIIFPSNWQLWRNFPDALQHWEHGEFLIPGIGQKIRVGIVFLDGKRLWELVLRGNLAVGRA
jgi:hypothetical protein